MKQYLNLLRTIRDTGTRQPNRTGIDTLMIPGAMMQFNLSKGFPAVTTKKLAFNAVKGELLGFFRGYTSAAQFRELGCNIWDQNANENKEWLANPNRKGTDDLGRIYGAQWVEWKPTFPNDAPINQIEVVLKKLRDNPNDRRMIITAWQPHEFAEMALPPCHVLYQFIADTTNRTLHMTMYQRSADAFLGVCFNIASAALLLSMIARVSGFRAGTFTHFLADAHIYVNHLEQVSEQLSRSPFCAPYLSIRSSTNEPWFPEYSYAQLLTIQPDDIRLEHYAYHPAIAAPMAV